MLSTYGEGGPSDDCMEFHRQLEDKSFFSDDLINNNICYSIFGLGSSKYEYFNAIAKKFDKYFTKQKFQRISEIGLGDDAKKINEDFETWRGEFWKNLFSYCLQNQQRINEIRTQLALDEKYLERQSEVKISLEKTACMNNIELSDYDYNSKRYLQAVECEIENIEEMRKEKINGSTLKIVYNIKDKNISYNIADNLGIFPTNTESSVNKILQSQKYDPSLIVNIENLNRQTKKPLSKKLAIINNISILDILTNIIDLSSQINKELIEKLLKFCFDEDQYDNLVNMIKKENKMNEFLNKNFNINDFLLMYDSVKIPFLEFYELMPKILPRFYTVASSPNFIKGRVEIIISLLSWKGPSGETCFGLASNYYKNIFENFNFLNKKFTTKLIIRESSFKLPKETTTPILMIATGTGIAPYISFLQEFTHQKCEKNKECHHSTLIFGSKNKKFDFLYEEHLDKYLQEKTLYKIYTAFSRDQENKFYVQNVLTQFSDEFVDLIQNKGAYLYICGGVTMGSEVVLALERIFSKQFIKSLENENRLVKELWG
jgi:NADPH-ferrihemoprotein reductase